MKMLSGTFIFTFTLQCQVTQSPISRHYMTASTLVRTRMSDNREWWPKQNSLEFLAEDSQWRSIIFTHSFCWMIGCVVEMCKTVFVCWTVSFPTGWTPSSWRSALRAKWASTLCIRTTLRWLSTVPDCTKSLWYWSVRRTWSARWTRDSSKMLGRDCLLPSSSVARTLKLVPRTDWMLNECFRMVRFPSTFSCSRLSVGLSWAGH